MTLITSRWEEIYWQKMDTLSISSLPAICLSCRRMSFLSLIQVDRCLEERSVKLKQHLKPFSAICLLGTSKLIHTTFLVNIVQILTALPCFAYNTTFALWYKETYQLLWLIFKYQQNKYAPRTTAVTNVFTNLAQRLFRISRLQTTDTLSYFTP